MLNGTLCATERTMCCIMENYQTEEGVNVPACLQPFMGGKTFIPYNEKKVQQWKDKLDEEEQKAAGKKGGKKDKKEKPKEEEKKQKKEQIAPVKQEKIDSDKKEPDSETYTSIIWVEVDGKELRKLQEDLLSQNPDGEKVMEPLHISLSSTFQLEPNQTTGFVKELKEELANVGKSEFTADKIKVLPSFKDKGVYYVSLCVENENLDKL